MHTACLPLRLQFRLPRPRTIHAIALIVLLRDAQVRQLRRHDSARRRARDQGVFAEVRDAALAEEVLVEQRPPADVLRGRRDDGQDGVGEDLRLAQTLLPFVILLVAQILLRGRGFDCL